MFCLMRAGKEKRPFANDYGNSKTVFVCPVFLN